MGRRFSNGFPCPLSAEDQAWVDQRWQWLAKQFGEDFPVKRPIVLPSATFFSNTSTDTPEGIEALFSRVCEYMTIERTSVVMVLFEPEPSTIVNKSSAVGYYRELADGKFEISVSRQSLDDPDSFVGTVAHELAHVHLLGHRRLTANDADHELLTDLLPIYFGVGIFGANSVIYEKSWLDGQMSHWQTGKIGYMSMAMHSYAMAKLAHHRQETAPAWATSLRRDIRAELQLFLDVIDGKSTLIEDPTDEVSATPAGEATIDDDSESDTSDTREYSPEEFLALYRNGTRDFQGMDFTQFQLVGAELNGCNFTDSDFTAADLSHAQLMDCDFTGATLKQTNLAHAKLTRSDLREAMLHWANLKHANLCDCNLCDTDFRGCELEGADISGSRRNRDTNFYGVDVSKVICDTSLIEEVTQVQNHIEQQYQIEASSQPYYVLTGLYAAIIAFIVLVVLMGFTTGIVSLSVSFSLFVLIIVYRIRKRLRLIRRHAESQISTENSTTTP